MKVTDIVTRVRNIAGDVNVLQFTDAQVLDWINDGIRECAIQNGLLQKRASSAVVNGQGGYPLPTDILKLHSVKYDNEKLAIKTMEEFDQVAQSDGTSRGNPVYAYVWAGTLNLFPIPDNSTKQLIIDYIYDPAVITAAGTPAVYTPDTPILPVGYHARLVDYCLAQVAQQDDDMNRYQLKMQEFSTGVQNLKDMPEYEDDLYPSISVNSRDMGDYEW